MYHGSEKRCKEVSDEGRKSNYEEVQGYVFSALLEGEAVAPRKLRSTADWVDPGTKRIASICRLSFWEATLRGY
jgi:hypothetical protein